MADLIASGYSGELYPINLRRHSVCGLPAHPNIGAVPHEVDLAVVVVDEAEVLDVARQCGAAGTRALVVLSAMTEAEAAGVPGHDDLLDICRAAGMRLIGPHSLGLLNTDPAAPLNASLIRSLPGRGPVGLMSQSGGVGVALTASADRLGLGLSNFVSVGSTADIAATDLLAYWDEDPATQVILLYLESFGNPRRFARIARRVSAHKPIVAVKSGSTSLGIDPVSSSTARLLADSGVGADLLFRQAGIIRTDSTSEMLEAAVLLAHQPAPAGNRVAVVSNSRGPAQLCADACRAAGLRVVDLSPTLLSDRLGGPAGPSSGGSNPVHLTSRASASDFAGTVSTLAQSGECDAVITLFVPSTSVSAKAVADAVDSAVTRSPAVTFATVLMDRITPPRPAPGRRHAARFMFPEEATRALGHATSWSLWRARCTGAAASDHPYSDAAARKVIVGALRPGPGWMSDADASALLDCYGLAPAQHSPGHVGDQHLQAGVVQDADFGPLLVCGRPGGEIAVRITPVSSADVQEMVRAMQVSGWKRAGSVVLGNVAALTDVLLRLGALIEANPEISALDLDRLSIGAAGAVVRAARVRLDPAPRSPAGQAVR